MVGLLCGTIVPLVQSIEAMEFFGFLIGGWGITFSNVHRVWE